MPSICKLYAVLSAWGSWDHFKAAAKPWSWPEIGPALELGSGNCILTLDEAVEL